MKQLSRKIKVRLEFRYRVNKLKYDYDEELYAKFEKPIDWSIYFVKNIILHEGVLADYRGWR